MIVMFAVELFARGLMCCVGLFLVVFALCVADTARDFYKSDPISFVLYVVGSIVFLITAILLIIIALLVKIS